MVPFIVVRIHAPQPLYFALLAEVALWPPAPGGRLFWLVDCLVATARLYYTDPYNTTFTSQVTALREAGAETWVALGETHFYPSAGGQPHDTGTLAGSPVIDVMSEGDEVWHRLAGTPPAVGQTVSGLVDWARRYRHMQRHSAQHLLSQAFLRVNTAFETQAVSLHSATGTVDLSGNPGDEALDAAEQLVNQIAYQNLAIESFFVPEAELAHYPLRRPPKVSGTVRLVQMGDWDLSACGGTHLRSTAEALPIKILGRERIRGGLIRVSFTAGLEALADYRVKSQTVGRLVQRFSLPPTQVLERVEALELELQLSAQHVKQLLNQLATLRAAALLAAAPVRRGIRLVSVTLTPPEAELLAPLAEALTKGPAVIALLGAAGIEQARLLFTRSPEVPLDMAALLALALPHVKGRGGGRPELAQGGGGHIQGLPDALDAALRRLEQDGYL